MYYLMAVYVMTMYVTTIYRIGQLQLLWRPNAHIRINIFPKIKCRFQYVYICVPVLVAVCVYMKRFQTKPLLYCNCLTLYIQHIIYATQWKYWFVMFIYIAYRAQQMNSCMVSLRFRSWRIYILSYHKLCPVLQIDNIIALFNVKLLKSIHLVIHEHG